jgi:hypothetical protein
MLIVAEKIAHRSRQQPIDIADPTKLAGLNDHLKARVGEKGSANLRRAVVIAINRDDDFKILMRLILNGAERIRDNIPAAIDWNADGDAIAIIWHGGPLRSANIPT